MHSDVHGMTWDDLRDAPAWDDVWPGVAKMLDGAAFVVAHNAAFDRGVLAACNAFAGIETPAMVWRCSKEAAWRHNGKRTGGKLSDMCAEFGIELNHHDPLSDAMACGRLMIALGGAS
jgi:DNA polymerase-3 subunit epsilon